jgi:predicted nucleotidyltransferase
VRAEKMLKTARKISRILIQFPYVRGVAVSGSLSKNYADENSDIDLFIITTANRLWIARTMMHLFKKLTFLVNKQNFFCMNYYIDEQGLEIIEKNIYTATEIVTLIPMEGTCKFDDFFAANAWTANYLPNALTQISTSHDRTASWFKRFIELMLNNRLGDHIDNKLRNITAKRWKKKTQQNKLNMRGVVMSMKANKHYSKPDPLSYQNKLIRIYNDKVVQLTTHEAIKVI